MDDLLSFLQAAGPKKLAEAARHFSPDLLGKCVVFLHQHPLSNNLPKLLSLIEASDNFHSLETIGKSLSVEQFLMLLLHVSKHPLLQNKLPPLLVGLPLDAFLEALAQMEQEQLDALKAQTMTEPLQHQLTLFIHDCQATLDQIHLNFSDCQNQISTLLLDQLPFEDLVQIEAIIQQLGQTIINKLTAINNAQTLLWNDSRIDLIDKLSRLKESFVHLLQQIGQSGTNGESSTGLYLMLEERLNQVFTPQDSFSDQREALQDDDSSLEGLTRFAIWYLKDYWELGLLPSIKHHDQLELDPQKYNEQERLEHRQQLFRIVQANLDQLKIGRIQDLKRAKIFSKPLLKRYLAQHHLDR